MNIVLIAVIALSFGSSIVAAQDTQNRSTRNVVSVPTGDPDMEAAMCQGRATLSKFFALAQAPKSSMSNFTLKVGIPIDGQFEFVWVRPFEKQGNRYSGQLRNDMRGKPLKFGDTISFSRSDIADWYYLDEGRMKGNFTACALVKNKSQSEIEAFKKQYKLDCDP